MQSQGGNTALDRARANGKTDVVKLLEAEPERRRKAAEEKRRAAEPKAAEEKRRAAELKAAEEKRRLALWSCENCEVSGCAVVMSTP
jgi:hypothetical protein